MFIGREQIREVLTTLSTNKARTILTGFAVGWGVLLLVILLSSGVGIRNGIERNFETAGYSDTQVELDFRSLSIPYEGKPKWYMPVYTMADCERIAQANSDIVKRYAPYSSTWRDLKYEDRTIDGNLTGTTSIRGELRRMAWQAPRSRFLSERDNLERRKVIVLNKSVATNLFGNLEDAVGRTIYIKEHPFQVIGVYLGENGRWSDNYIPLSTLQTLNLGWRRNASHAISGMVLDCPTIISSDDTEAFEARLLAQLSKLKGFSPEDNNAISVDSQASNLETARGIFTGIDTFLWVIGLSTLIIGVIGVINIMQVAVTERQREIGIRKALGARPRDIIRMILTESILITLVSGLLGLVVGVSVMAGVDAVMTAMGIGQKTIFDSTSYIFIHPVITLETAIATILVMLTSGVLAGYLPARKALAIPVVEAMRN